MVNNIEKYNVEREKISNDKVMAVVRKLKQFKSIKELDKNIPDMSYGAVWKAVQRLHEYNKIIIYKSSDRSGRNNTMIFLDEESKNNFLQKFEKDFKVDLTSIKLSDLVRKINIYELFSTVMNERPNQTTQYTDHLSNIIKDIQESEKLNKFGSFSVFHVQMLLIKIILDIMEIDFDEVTNLHGDNKDIEVFING